MENFINPLLLGEKNLLEHKTSKFSVKQLACAGLGSLLVGAALKKTGHAKTGALVAGLALPLITAACYKKFKKRASRMENMNKSTDISGEFY